MEAMYPTLINICRFCLSDDDQSLVLFRTITDHALTIEDVCLFTGIVFRADETMSYTVCLECINKLKASAAFQRTCKSNDTLFREVCQVLRSADYPRKPSKSDEPMQAADTVDLDHHHHDEASNQQTPDVISVNEQLQDQPDDLGYSANYIDIGEPDSSDSELEFEYGEPVPYFRVVHRVVRYGREYVRGGRRFHLCDRCGTLVPHLKSHFENHQMDVLESCPYCPFKTAPKRLIAHVNTVHLKKIYKTCEICGKGFVHHKTYRYHMTIHKDEGKTFECKLCEKTFTSSISLKDHFNRMHNITRKAREKIPRKRQNRRNQQNQQ